MKKIVIAVAAPLSGAQREYGLQLEKGVGHAVRMLNEAGGIHGHEIELFLEDDHATVEGAIAAAHRIVARGTDLVVGHYISDCSIAASGIYATNRIIQIAPSTTTPSFTEVASEKGWSTLFRTCGRDDKQGAMAAKYISKNFGSCNLAIVHNNRPYGMNLSGMVRRYLNSDSVFEQFYESFDASDTGQTNLMIRLKTGAISFLYVGGYYTDVGPLLRGLRERGFKGKMMTGGACANQHLFRIAGSATDGLLLTCRPDARLADCAIDAVTSIRREGFEPEGYTLSSVAAVECWALAVGRCKSMDPLEVARALRSGAFDTSYGTLDFDAKGDVTNPLYAIHEWQAGVYGQL